MCDYGYVKIADEAVIMPQIFQKSGLIYDTTFWLGSYPLTRPTATLSRWARGWLYSFSLREKVPDRADEGELLKLSNNQNIPKFIPNN
jgi:hypothetical protein